MERVAVGNAASPENSALALEKQNSGNGLVEEFSDMTNSKAVPAPGGSGESAEEAKVDSPESGPRTATNEGGGGGKAVAAPIDSTADANAAKAKPNGSTMQEAAGEFGKYKTSGVTDAFPSSAELLRGLKA